MWRGETLRPVELRFQAQPADESDGQRRLEAGQVRKMHLRFRMPVRKVTPVKAVLSTALLRLQLHNSDYYGAAPYVCVRGDAVK